MALHKNMAGASLHELKGVADAANDEVPTASAHTTVWKKLTADNLEGTGNPFGGQLFHAYEARAINVNGGSLLANTWTVRQFTTTGKSQISGVNRSNGNITFPAGDYIVQAWAAGHGCGMHQLRLATTTGSILVTGIPAGFDDTTDTAVLQTIAHLSGTFTLATSKTVQLQHNCQSTKTTTGQGNAAGLGPEHYSDLMIWKVG
jgi:hypothetical protein